MNNIIQMYEVKTSSRTLPIFSISHLPPFLFFLPSILPFFLPSLPHSLPSCLLSSRPPSLPPALSPPSRPSSLPYPSLSFTLVSSSRCLSPPPLSLSLSLSLSVPLGLSLSLSLLVHSPPDIYDSLKYAQCMQYADTHTLALIGVPYIVKSSCT